jgi:hypothetical protein
LKTYRLHIDAATPAGFPIALHEIGVAEPLAQHLLTHAEVDAADWPPAAIHDAFFPIAAPKASVLEEIGLQLGRWACGGDLKAALAQRALAGGARLLLDVAAPELAALPWELVRCGDTFDALNEVAPLARLHRVDARLLPPPPAWPLRVLIVVGSGEKAGIGAEEEVAAIERALHPWSHSVDREIVRRPSKAVLREMLGGFQPHVFLFIGHCDADGQGVPRLKFEFDDDLLQYWDLTPNDLLAEMAHRQWSPSLVILNACRTAAGAGAASAGESAGHSLRFMGALAGRSVPACITMQGDVRGDLAGVFSAAVLRHVCSGRPLDAAVAAARNEVEARPEIGTASRDWAYPVLSLALERIDQLFQKPLADPAAARPVASIADDVLFTADRRDVRRELRRRVAGPHAPGDGLVLLTGAARSGKSHVARWCLEHFRRVYGALVHYVPMSSPRNDELDLFEVLQRIRGANERPPPLPARHFAEFLWNAKRILSGGTRGEWLEGLPQPKEDELKYRPNRLKYPDARADLVGGLADGLARAAQEEGRPVVIVLDQFRSSTDRPYAVDASDIRDVIVPGLLGRAAAGAIPGVLLMAVLERGDCTAFGVDRIASTEQFIELPPHLADRPEPLAREMLWYPQGNQVADKLSSAMDLVRLGFPTVDFNLPQTPADYLGRLRDTFAATLGGAHALRAELKVRQMG